MKRLKPVYISILVIVVFAIALAIGMQSDWWMLEGRKTPLDDNFNKGHDEEEHVKEVDYSGEEEHGEDDHEKTEVSGGSTVQDALDLGISLEDIEEILEGKIDDKNELIKDIVTARGLKFGQVKDGLNALID